jgi:hypothetical protein
VGHEIPVLSDQEEQTAWRHEARHPQESAGDATWPFPHASTGPLTNYFNIIALFMA